MTLLAIAGLPTGLLFVVGFGILSTIGTGAYIAHLYRTADRWSESARRLGLVPTEPDQPALIRPAWPPHEGRWGDYRVRLEVRYMDSASGRRRSGLTYTRLTLTGGDLDAVEQDPLELDESLLDRVLDALLDTDDRDLAPATREAIERLPDLREGRLADGELRLEWGSVWVDENALRDLVEVSARAADALSGRPPGSGRDSPPIDVQRLPARTARIL